MNKNKLLFSLLRVTLLVLIAITAFLYAQYVILPGLAVVYSHIIGIAFGVLVIGATAYRVQKTQEKLLNEKIDATERRMKFEASLRNVEENYRKLFFESMDGVSRTTLDGKIIEANQAFCDILGCDAEKIIGEMITQFYDNPEDRLTFRGAVEKNRGVANFELVQKRVDGARIVCSISSSYFYSQNGEPEGYLTIMRDITDRKRTEQEMAILAEIGRLIGLTMNIEEVYEKVAIEARRLIPFDGITVSLCHIRENIATVAYVAGEDLTSDKQGDSLPMAGTLIEELVRSRNGMIVQSKKMDEIVDRIPSFAKNYRAGLRSLIGIPLIYKDGVIGVLYFWSKTPAAYSLQDLRLAERIGAQIAGAIANTQLFADLKKAEEEQRRSRENAERLAEETAIVAEIGRVIGSTMNIDEVYERFVTEVKRLIHFDRLSVNLLNPDGKSITIAYLSGFDIADQKPGATIALAGSLSELFASGDSGMIVHVESLEDLFRQFPSVKDSPVVRAGIRSMIGVPLIYRNATIGFLHFRSKRPLAYTEQDLKLAERIGAQIAGALGAAELLSDLRKTDKSLRESESRFRALIEQAAVGVAEVEVSTGRFCTVNSRLCAMVGRTQEELTATTFPAITHPEDIHIHEANKALLLAGKIGHYTLEKRCLRKDGRNVWVNLTVSPLWKPGEEPGRSMVVVEDITDRKRAAEALKESEQKYRELSIIDDLTKLYNSRHFYFHLKNEMERSNRYGHPLTLLLLDLDNFKHFNDTFGHVEGDQVLWRLGQVVKRCLRETDFAYRYGGEEFTVLLPMTTSVEGLVTAERIRTEFRKEIFTPAPDQEVRVTVSIGLAQFTPPEEMKFFVHRVDQLMYQGKRNGKDRVCCELSAQGLSNEQSALPF